MPQFYHRSSARFGDPLDLFPRGLKKLYTIWLRMTYPFASMGSNVSIHYTCSVSRMAAHRIRLGNFVQIHKEASLGGSLPAEVGEPVIIIDDNCIIHWRSRNCPEFS